MPESTLAIADLLRELGFDSPESQRRAREALVTDRLTTPTKVGIAGEKRDRVVQSLQSHFLVTCGAPACARGAAGREIVIAEDRARCWICGGSNNRSAVDQAAALFRRHGIRRIVVVGGSPSVHDELRQLAPPEWELRLIDGTTRRTADAAKGDLRWADLVLVWGSSELDHKVSLHYTAAGALAQRVVVVNRRGIAALIEGAMRFVGGAGKP
jgi:hypothetical protein